MDTAEAAFEADIDLDGQALQQEQTRRKDSRGQGERATNVSNGGIETTSSRHHNGAHNTASDHDRDANETSPLLPPDQSPPDDTSPPADFDFSHLPWYKRPSIFWVLGPFFLMTCAFGGVLTPKLNLILELVCKRYISERELLDPNFTAIPIDFNDGDNDQCRIPAVQRQVADFMLWASLIAGILSAVTSPKLGALSDRYGRKKILILTSLGTIAGEVITIAAAMYPESFPVNWLLLGYALDGLTGSFIVAMAIANSYATDCTPPAMRSVAFGYFHGCLFTGLAIGPILAGYLVRKTGKIVIVFYILTAVHIFFILFIAFVVPESLTKARQLAAREKHKKKQEEAGPSYDIVNQLRSLNLLSPLKILYPTGSGSSPALRRNLFSLAAVDTIVFGVAMGTMTVIVIYTNYMFGWKSFESGRFMTIVNSSRVFCLLVVLPLLTRLFRADTGAGKKSEGMDRFEVNIIRIAILFDTIGYLGYTLSTNGAMMILSGTVAAIGGIASPTLQSALTKHVPAEQTGQLLGASGLLHALARVVAPTVFNAIYAATVDRIPQTVFLSLAVTFALAFVISLFLRTGVYFDEEEAENAREHPPASDDRPEQEGQGTRLPIVGSVVAVTESVRARMTSGAKT